MSLEYASKGFEESALREPIFNAMDELRLALDQAVELGNDRIAGLLLIALHDLADTIELTLEEEGDIAAPCWTVTERGSSSIEG